jgi:protein-L-isoaspartate O-methyltransferase
MLEGSNAWLSLIEKHLHEPRASHGVRVLALGVGLPGFFGAACITINPWYEKCLLPWPLNADTAADLASYGIALSLVDALHAMAESGGQSSGDESALRIYLLAICTHSAHARAQMNYHSCMPLPLGTTASDAKTAGKIIAMIIAEKVGSALGHATATTTWAGWSPWYEVWVNFGPSVPGSSSSLCKMRVGGVNQSYGLKSGGSMDRGGVSMTGGRLWPASLLLMRWLMSMTGRRGDDETRAVSAFGGDGRVLEIGAGLGLVSIALARQGLKVVASDREPALVAAIAENAVLNGVPKRCKPLLLDWSDGAQPAARQLLKAQRFKVVVGADLVYSLKGARAVPTILRHALPCGGTAFVVNAVHHREGVAAFEAGLADAGFQVHSQSMCEEGIDPAVWGDYEPGQEWRAYTITVPPMTAVKHDI